MSEHAQNGNVGKIVEIKGVVVDAVFSGDLPDIYNALAIEVPTRRRTARAAGRGR